MIRNYFELTPRQVPIALFHYFYQRYTFKSGSRLPRFIRVSRALRRQLYALGRHRLVTLVFTQSPTLKHSLSV